MVIDVSKSPQSNSISTYVNPNKQISTKINEQTMAAIQENEIHE